MQMRDKVREAYSAAALTPDARHAFPVGRVFASSLAYQENAPAAALEAFAGVSNVPAFACIPEGATVLDLGCGAGLDTWLVAPRARRVIGADFSLPMLRRASSCRPVNTMFTLAAAERLPLQDASIDVALVNGIFNLNPSRAEIFAELARVLKPGAHLYAAELILASPLPEDERRREDDWFA
ncbi:MAG: methyltransferase domain-containing protein [Bryobacteraceae bacterium]|nr:methyltransferase domain-containing protein [Bryobacteraceae bacterium]